MKDQSAWRRIFDTVSRSCAAAVNNWSQSTSTTVEYVSAYRCDVGKARNSAMAIGISGWENKICIATQNEERRSGVFPRIQRSEGRVRNTCTDPRQLSDISTPVLAGSSMDRTLSVRYGTHVSLTPAVLGHSIAISVIRSESRSIPPVAPGSSRGECYRLILTQKDKTHNCRRGRELDSSLRPQTKKPLEPSYFQRGRQRSNHLQ